MINFYYPGKDFPSISITGDACALSCPHCEKRFLRGMTHISDAEELYKFACELEKSGGKGFLLSGGCNEQGMVPIKDYCNALSLIKDNTSLELNIHTGLPDRDLVKRLSEIDVDVVSYDMIGSEETIKMIYGLDVSPLEYKNGYKALKESGIKVVPHITVGLNAGKLKGEFKAIDMIDDGSKIVLNTLIPTYFGDSVKKKDLLSVIDYISPDTEIIIGCMRERGRNELEIESLKRGVEGIVLPSKKTERWAKRKFEVKRTNKCCVF